MIMMISIWNTFRPLASLYKSYKKNGWSIGWTIDKTKTDSEKESVFLPVVSLYAFGSDFGFLDCWLELEPTATLDSDVQPMPKGRTTNLSTRSFIGCFMTEKLDSEYEYHG